jgi:hypothetical protein
LLALVALIALLSSVAMAQDGDPPSPQGLHIAQVSVGFSGAYKVGFWTPVEVAIRGGDEAQTGRIRLLLPDGDGEMTEVTSDRAVQVLPGGTSRMRLYAKFGQVEGSLKVQFVADGEVLTSLELTANYDQGRRYFPYAMDSTDELILTLGPALGVASALQAGESNADGPSARVVQLPGVEGLPTRWYGLEGVDAVVLATSRPEVYRSLTPTQAQSRALIEWVEMGGRLVMCVGREAPELLAPGAVLDDLAPGKFSEMIALRRTAPLENYLDTTERIDAGPRFRVEAPKLVDVEGRIETHEGRRATDLPLVIRAPRVFGEVVFMAIDLDRPPFATWEGRSQVINKLLARTVARAIEVESDALGSVTTVGYNDLVGQLRAALDQFRGVRMVPFALVAALVVGYLLLIGPLDYWLVKKVLRRMEATWITFPLWVIGISVVAYYSAYWLKGRDLRVNEVELVDVDMASGQIRGTTWSNIFSPRPDTYNLSLDTKLPGVATPPQPPQVLLSWMGLPGGGLGGMSSNSKGSLFRDAYQFSPTLDRLENVPIQVWSTKGITSRWRQRASLPLEFELTEDSERMLRGRLANQLGVELRDARLFYDRWVYPIVMIPDGGEIAVGESLQPLLSKTLLTRERTEEDRLAVSNYDEESLDVERTVEMMMFHNLAGGAPYTGLWNRYQSFSDLTSTLRSGRAVLVARLAAPVATLLRDDQAMAADDTQRWSYIRFVLPVSRDE